MPHLQPAAHETITGLQQKFRTGECTPYDVVTNALDRILSDEIDIQAWCRLYEEQALEQAHSQTALLQQNQAQQDRTGPPKNPGPLAGIPVGIKDIIDVAGSPTGCGFVPFQTETAARNAVLVQQLLDAGAILLGKTITTQFACFDPPETRNPWNLNRTPGGSSSGSAAAVASGMCLAALGTQTGGSVTRPAAYCGLVGFKPGYNQLDTAGIFPVSKRLDQPGFFTRSVADARLLWDICKPAGSPPSPLASPPVAAPSSQFSRSLRIRHLTQDTSKQISAEMLHAVQQFVSRLQKSTQQIDASPLPIDFDTIRAHHWNIMAYEAAGVHQQLYKQHPGHYLPGLSSLLEDGFRLSTATYQKSCQYQDDLQKKVDQLLQNGPPQTDEIWIGPATSGEAPDLSTTGDPWLNSPWSFLGLPTLTLPLALSDHGLPLGLQLVGARQAEDKLLEAGLFMERLIQTG